MKFKPQTLHTIQTLNNLLLHPAGGAAESAAREKAMQTCLENADLDDLFSNETLTRVRARGKNALVIFLSTLAVSNEFNVRAAAWWRDLYQTVARKQPQGHVERLTPRHVLRQVAMAAGAERVLSMGQFKTMSGQAEHWQDAFELAIDHRQWATAQNLLEHLGRTRLATERWMKLGKSLVFRKEVIPEFADFRCIARMYELMQLALRNAGALEISDSLLFMQGDALKQAGEYEKAVDVYRRYMKCNPVAGQIEIARCQCKQGQLLEAVASLDAVLLHPERFAHGLDADGNDQQKLMLPNPAATSFDVSKANVALADLVSLMSQTGQKIFLVSGTLLGYAREGKLMDHDKDIDVGMLGWEGMYDAVMHLITSGQFEVSPTFLKGEDTHYIAIMHIRTGVWIDLFIYHQIEDKWVTGVDFFFGYRQTFAFTPFEFKPVKFLGVDMYVPGDTDLNLEENFGNWRVPDPGYISHLESPSLVGKGELSHMITARMWAVQAIQKHHAIKLRKVLEMLDAFADRPGAMAPELRQSLWDLQQRFEQETQLLQSADRSVLEEALETAHA